MKSIEGLYSALNAIIGEFEEEGHAVLDSELLIEKVKDEVDVYSATLDWYIHFALRAAASVALYTNGYKSVVHGEGLFVNLDKISRPEYAAKLFNNSVLSQKQKKVAHDALLKGIKQSGCDNQLTWDFETGLAVEEMSAKQLIELLREDAHSEKEGTYDE